LPNFLHYGHDGRQKNAITQDRSVKPCGHGKLPVESRSTARSSAEFANVVILFVTARPLHFPNVG
jgi:hypothetical protein